VRGYSQGDFIVLQWVKRDFYQRYSNSFVYGVRLRLPALRRNAIDGRKRMHTSRMRGEKTLFNVAAQAVVPTELIAFCCASPGIEAIAET
jgi:hypothetical protein